MCVYIRALGMRSEMLVAICRLIISLMTRIQAFIIVSYYAKGLAHCQNCFGQKEMNSFLREAVFFPDSHSRSPIQAIQNINVTHLFFTVHWGVFVSLFLHQTYQSLVAGRRRI